jgi:hypothetical protein
MKLFYTAIVSLGFLLGACSRHDSEQSGSSLIDSLLVPDRNSSASGPLSDVSVYVPDSLILHQVINRPIVLYVEASHSEIAAMRSSGISEDDFHIIADDLMNYRANAIDYLKEHNYPLLRIEGRRPIRFRVSQAPRTYDFVHEDLLDFIVVYEPDREPRVVAPNEVKSVATYFGHAP